MAGRRSSPISIPQHANLSLEQKRRGIERLKKRIDDLEKFDPAKIQERWSPEVLTLGTAIEETLSAVFGQGTVEYNRYRSAEDLDDGPVTYGGESSSIYEVQKYISDGRKKSLLSLHQAIRGLEEEIAEQENDAPQLSVGRTAIDAEPSKVFVVHGHDTGSREAVARFLEKIGLEAIILHEQPDQGLTIIEKFEAHAKQVRFAVVLLTPDDIGGTVVDAPLAARARQNVIFELGYFAGKLGRGRACLLRKGEIEIPSDLYGVIYSEMDAAEGWKLKLAKELKAAGLKFDGDKVF